MNGNGIDLQQIEFGYDASRLLFQELSLTLIPGQIVGLFGKNGAGKTSLLKLLAGLVFPQQGQCGVLGYDPSRRLPEFLADIYYVPEDFYVPEITAARFEYLYSPFYPKFNRQNFQENLTAFELPNDKLLSNLSYGQRKKFLIAFALATHTRLLLLDEPSHHLDIPSKSQFRKLLASMISEEKIFIISTHQVKDMENLIDRIIFLDKGKIIFREDVDTIGRHLLFEKRQNLADVHQPLYVSQDLGGYDVISKNEQGLENQIDIEVLFNAILTDPEKINSVFTPEIKHEQ
jgi:ABC-2 type transport system ATP-binding protein